MAGWSIVRTIDGRAGIQVYLGFGLKSGQKQKLFACEYLDEETWGSGCNVTTVLRNHFGVDRATHVQKTVYTN